MTNPPKATSSASALGSAMRSRPEAAARMPTISGKL